MNAQFVHRSYLFVGWLWLVVCLAFPIWTGKSYADDAGGERWCANRSFEISVSGHSFASAVPIWQPPRPFDGMASKVRWPLTPIELANCVEIQVAATFWRFAVDYSSPDWLPATVNSLSRLSRYAMTSNPSDNGISMDSTKSAVPKVRVRN